MDYESYKEKIKKENIRKYYVKKKREKILKTIQDVNILRTYDELAKKDPIYRIAKNLANRINLEVNKHNIIRKSSYLQLLGCSYKDFKKYLSNKFTDGMTFENYGEWEVDHIYPISKTDFTNIDEIKKCFHYTNLQPLWKEENRMKYNKIT